MNLPDWLKNLLVLIAVVLVLWIVWSLVKAVLTVLVWAIAIGVVGFALKWVFDKVRS